MLLILRGYNFQGWEGEADLRRGSDWRGGRCVPDSLVCQVWMLSGKKGRWGVGGEGACQGV